MEKRTKRERFTPRELDVIVELTDNEGYTQKELMQKTGVIKNNLSAYLTEFEQNGIVYRKIETDKKKTRGNKGSDEDSYYPTNFLAMTIFREKFKLFSL